MLENKKALIIGVASERSIAYGIAHQFHKFGATLAFSYANERLKDRVTKIANNFDSKLVMPCDLAKDEEIDLLFDNLQNTWGTFDILIHSAAFAPREQFEGDYLDVINRESFNIAHDISSYSFSALAKSARKLLNPNGALLTLSYLGAEKVVPNYNVMGIAKASLEANVRYMAHSLGKYGVRVNGISAGAIKTLAASGIKNFKSMLSSSKEISPLQRELTIEDIGNVASFVCSDLASSITGEIIHADNGMHMIALPDLST